MLTTIEKLGDSQVIRIPDGLLQGMQFSENEPVDISLEQACIVIRKDNSKRRHKTTEERLREFYGDDYEKYLEDPKKFHVMQKEVDWGSPVGNEVW